MKNKNIVCVLCLLQTPNEVNITNWIRVKFTQGTIQLSIKILLVQTMGLPISMCCGSITTIIIVIVLLSFLLLLLLFGQLSSTT